MIQEKDLPKDVLKIMGETHAERIDSLVKDIIKNSCRNTLQFNPEMLSVIEKLREFLYLNVYSRANALIEDSRVEHVLTALFEYEVQKEQKSVQETVDFISGMTDRYALQLSTPCRHHGHKQAYKPVNRLINNLIFLIVLDILLPFLSLH